MEYFNWFYQETGEHDTAKGFNYPGLVIIDVPADGSCFFHALILSIYKPYQLNKINKWKFVREFRKNLAYKLIEDYDKLSNGKLKELSKEMPEVSLSAMIQELDSSKAISNIYNEFISDLLNRDIYLLDYQKKDVYMTGSDLNLLYKGRKSTVLVINGNHYQLVGIKKSDGSIKVGFDHDHPFILKIQKRIKELIH